MAYICNEILSLQVKLVVDSFGQPLSFRSFKPFLPALCCHQIPSVQLWALWSIDHLYSTDHLIPDEKLCSLLRSIIETQMSSTVPDASIQQKAQHLLEMFTSVH